MSRPTAGRASIPSSRYELETLILQVVSGFAAVLVLRETLGPQGLNPFVFGSIYREEHSCAVLFNLADEFAVSCRALRLKKFDRVAPSLERLSAKESVAGARLRHAVRVR